MSIKIPPKATIELLYKTDGTRFICLCGKERKNKSGITSHIKEVHFEIKRKIHPYNHENNCFNCKKSFVRKEGLNRHIKQRICMKKTELTTEPTPTELTIEPTQTEQTEQKETSETEKEPTETNELTEETNFDPMDIDPMDW